MPELRETRARVVADWTAQEGKPRDLPNDESFVCSHLKANGGRCTDVVVPAPRDEKAFAGAKVPRTAAYDEADAFCH